MSQDIGEDIHLHWMSLSRGVETPLLTLNRHVPEARPHAAAGAGESAGLVEVQPGNLSGGRFGIISPKPPLAWEFRGWKWIPQKSFLTWAQISLSRS